MNMCWKFAFDKIDPDCSRKTHLLVLRESMRKSL